jgi:hypothetical protein
LPKLDTPIFLSQNHYGHYGNGGEWRNGTLPDIEPFAHFLPLPPENLKKSDYVFTKL